MLIIIKDGKEYAVNSWCMLKHSYPDSVKPMVNECRISLLPIIEDFEDSEAQGVGQTEDIFIIFDSSSKDIIEKIFGDIVKVARGEKIYRGKWASEKHLKKNESERKLKSNEETGYVG